MITFYLMRKSTILHMYTKHEPVLPLIPKLQGNRLLYMFLTLLHFFGRFLYVKIIDKFNIFRFAPRIIY